MPARFGKGLRSASHRRRGHRVRAVRFHTAGQSRARSLTQQFRLDDLGNGYVKFVNRSSGRCVDVPDFSHADRVGLQLWNCVGDAENQEFRLNIS